MKKILIGIVLLAAVFFIYKKFIRKKSPFAPPPVALTVSAHSADFNNNVQQALDAYYAMAGAFASWDAGKVAAQAQALQQALQAIPLQELKKDTVMYQTAAAPLADAQPAVATIAGNGGWDTKREALQPLTENLRTFLITVKYDREKIFYQQCPMAFGEGRSGNWLSRSQEINNPYLGDKHPRYGSTMLQCGETVTVIDFVPAPSADKK